MFAARMTDPTLHGGFIAFGEPTVLIGALPAARQFDPHICPLIVPPLPPHVGGFIATGSATVFIGGLAAARQFDICACAVAPLSIAKQRPPPDPSKTTWEQLVDGFKERRVTTLEDKNKDGTVEKRKEQVALDRYDDSREFLDGWVRTKAEVLAGYSEVEVRQGSDEQPHVGLKGEAGVARAKGTFSVGPDKKNPLWSLEVTGRGGSVEVKGDAPQGGVGTDGTRYGAWADVGAGAAALKGEAKLKFDAATIPPVTFVALVVRRFLGVNLDIAVAGSAEAGTAGGGLLAAAYYDTADARVHVAIGGELGAAILGAGFAGEVTVGVMDGRRFGDALWGDDSPTIAPEVVERLVELGAKYVAAYQLAMTPNSIVVGCGNVLIGD